MKNKKLIIYIIIGITIIVIGAIIVIAMSNKGDSDQAAQTPPEDTILSMRPEEIGLTLTATDGNKEVILEVENTEGILGLDYELSYKSKGDIPRGVIGHIDVENPGQKVSQKITLGTCSDVCHYDEDVSDIKLMLKVAKTDGTTAQIEKLLDLE